MIDIDMVCEEAKLTQICIKERQANYVTLIFLVSCTSKSFLIRKLIAQRKI